jgi:hypothetical protein
MSAALTTWSLSISARVSQRCAFSKHSLALEPKLTSGLGGLGPQGDRQYPDEGCISQTNAAEIPKPFKAILMSSGHDTAGLCQIVVHCTIGECGCKLCSLGVAQHGLSRAGRARFVELQAAPRRVGRAAPAHRRGGEADAAESGYFAVRGMLAKSVAEAERLALLWQILTGDRRSGIPKSVFQ